MKKNEDLLKAKDSTLANLGELIKKIDLAIEDGEKVKVSYKVYGTHNSEKIFDESIKSFDERITLKLKEIREVVKKEKEGFICVLGMR